MIIEAFAVFFVLAFLFIIVGYKSENIVMQLAGFALIALLSFTFLTGSIEFKTGQTVEECENVINFTDNVYVYGNNYTGYHWDYDYDLNPSFNDYNLFHVKEYNTYTTLCTNSTTTNNYEDFNGLDNTILGVFILFAGVVGLIGVWDQYRKKGRSDEEEN